MREVPKNDETEETRQELAKKYKQKIEQQKDEKNDRPRMGKNQKWARYSRKTVQNDEKKTEMG